MILARTLIGLELFLGILLIMNFRLRKFTIPVTVVLLILFTIFLVIDLIRYGNTGNCGCMGSIIQFTPFEAILKNLGMLAIAFLISRNAITYTLRRTTLFVTVVFLSMFTLPYILNPIYFQSDEAKAEKLNVKLDLDLLYNDSVNQPPAVDLRKGKWVIAFMSLKCKYCKVAAKKFHIMKSKDPSLPIYMVLNGDSTNLPRFFADTHAENVPWSTFLGPEKFRTFLLGPSLPQIYFVNYSVIEKRADYFFLNEAQITDWLKQP